MQQDTIKTVTHKGSDTLLLRQDTLQSGILNRNDTHLLQLDSTTAFHHKAYTELVTKPNLTAGELPSWINDTSSVCSRGAVTEITFHDSTNFVMTIDPSVTGRFPFVFTEYHQRIRKANNEILARSLKEGFNIQEPAYKSDWMVPVLLFSFFLFAVVRTIPGNFFRNIVRFILLRGINENSSRDTGLLFQWQATLLNFASFIIIAVFGYLSLDHFNVSISGAGRFVTWLICFGTVVSAITSRHFICNITGNISGQAEIFREYITGIYHVYRAAGIVFSVLVLLILYSSLFPENMLFAAGFLTASILYILRVIRLMLIFIKRHVSIFYLILYLCALEILPVVIIVKYITGLV